MAEPGRADAMLAEREDRVFAYCTLLPSALLFLLLIIVPTVTVVLMSLQDVGIGETSGPFVGLDNFVWAFTSSTFFGVLVNTLIWVFGSVALEMVLGLGVALLLNRNFVGRGVARAIVFAPYIIPTVVAVLVWKFMFHDILGILNHGLIRIGIVDAPVQWLASPRTAMLSVILVAVWKLYPFVVLALLGILQSIPQEQYEAATVDGASAFQQFWRITLPYVMPVFLLTALLRTIWTFHKFDIIYMLTGGGPLGSTTTLPVLVYQKAFDDFEMGRGAAVALITAAILVVLSAIYALLIRWSERRQ